MSRIPESEIERIKREVDLLALIQSKGLVFQKHGSNDHACHCPFHKEKSASLIVTPSENLWHCMGCGGGGSVFDFVMKYEGVSFRHAYEILSKGDVQNLLRSGPPIKHSSTPKLKSPVSFDADDYTLTAQVVEYYHKKLKETPQALEYLHGRGITDEAIDTFQIGFADRTLGLTLPSAVVKAGGEIRDRLKKIGLFREKTGHEHFSGCVTFPIKSEVGITEVYGRKVYDNLRPGTHYHLYLPNPHIGIFNGEVFKTSREIILCESIIDALSFWCAGFKNATCIYGTEGFSQDIWDAFLSHKTERVYLAYDRDEAGDRATERDSVRFLSKGIECYRVKFPKGMDANEYSRKVTPAEKSLGLLIRSAEWLGKGQRDAGPVKALESIKEPVLESSPESLHEIKAESLPHLAPTSSSLLAAKLAAEEEEKEQRQAANKIKEEPLPVTPVPAVVAVPVAVPKPVESVPDSGDFTVEMGERQWRVRGLDKNTSCEVLRVNLRLWHRGLYHINVVDLYQAKQRQHFIEDAAKETLLDLELIKRDLGKLLLKLEEIQEQRTKAAVAVNAPTTTGAMPEPEREEALKLLREPNVLDRILKDFDACGIVGERTNKLCGYLATVSRKLEKPLAIIIQSTSAAGKSSLMDAILSFIPPEEKIKYSAMTGQSLYYLGEKNLKHKILAIVEEEGAEKASYALKLLQSEGELTIASTCKDDQGRMKTEEYRVEGPVMIILTTTAIDIDEELLNRCIVLTVDESREQTAAIHHLQREAETLSGLERKLEREKIWKIHQNAQRLLRPLHVVNPYAPRLTFLSDRTRTRRDHMKYLTLIRTVTLLHQYQREIKTLPNGTEYIEVTLDDITAANQIAHEVLGRSLDELPPQTRRLLGLLESMVREQSQQQKINPRKLLFSRRQVRDWTGWGNTQIRIHLDRLVELEYLLPHRGSRGQTFVYELLFDGDIDTGKPQLIGLIDPQSFTCDSKLAGQTDNLAGPKRPENGEITGPKQDGPTEVNPLEKNVLPWKPALEEETSRPEKKDKKGKQAS